MATNFLYIDDETDDKLNSYIRAVADGEILTIEAKQPDVFERQLTELLLNPSKYSGIILDWRLDENPNPSGDYIIWRAAALAQELRTKATEQRIFEIPIVLWSTDDKLTKSFYGDMTGHDLFDERYDKQKVTDEPVQTRNELISLSEGYKRLNKIREEAASKILGLTPEQFDSIDERFAAIFREDTGNGIHDLARVLLKEVIKRPGLLLDEALLAARLGVDQESSKDWPLLLGKLPATAKYTGPFSEAWDRWWASEIEKTWWRSLQKKSSPLSSLEARQRVEILKKSLGLNELVPSGPIDPSYSTRFYTICQATQKPLDPIDGVMMNEKEPLPWQDRRYISVDAALKRIGVDENVRPHPIEVERLQEILRGLQEVYNSAEE